MNTYPDTFDIDRLYKFERIHDGHSAEARLVVFDDGSATIIGALDCDYEDSPQALENAVQRLKEEGFTFKGAGKIVRLEDFPPQPGEDILECGRRWARALET